jgi:hypothetical protein
MPAKVQLYMINAGMYLARPVRRWDDPKNPKSWEQSINHNRAQAAVEVLFILGVFTHFFSCLIAFRFFCGY